MIFLCCRKYLSSYETALTPPFRLNCWRDSRYINIYLIPYAIGQSLLKDEWSWSVSPFLLPYCRSLDIGIRFDDPTQPQHPVAISASDLIQLRLSLRCLQSLTLKALGQVHSHRPRRTNPHAPTLRVQCQPYPC